MNVMIHPLTLPSADIVVVGMDENRECNLHKAVVGHYCRVTWCGAAYHDVVEGVGKVAYGGTPLDTAAAATGAACYDTWVTVADVEDATRTAAEWRCGDMLEESEDGIMVELVDGMLEELVGGLADMLLHSR